MADKLITKQELISSGFFLNKKFVMIDSTKYTPEAFEYILNLADETGSIIFVSDTKKIWAKGKYFGGDIFQADLLYFTEFEAIDGDGNKSSTSAQHPKSKLTFKTDGHLNATAVYKEDSGENEINFNYDLDGAVNKEEFQFDPKSLYNLNVVNGQIKIEKYTPISISLPKLNPIEYDSGDKELTCNVGIFGGNTILSFGVTTITGRPEEPELVLGVDSAGFFTVLIPNNTNVTIKVNASDGKSGAEETVSQNWGYACYYGSSTNAEMTLKEEILGAEFKKYITLNDPSKTITIEQNREAYGYFVCPAIFKVEFIDVSTNLTGGWRKIGSFTNYSFNETYNIYRTEQTGLGYMKWNVTKK